MRYTSERTLKPGYFEAITGLTVAGHEECAGVLVEPGTQWDVLPYDNNYFLEQPLKIRKPLDSGNGHVLTPLSGVLFVQHDGFELYTSYPKHSVKKWWPFPSPIDYVYDNLINNQHVRPFPGVFEFKFENLTGTFNSRIEPLLKNLIALRFAHHIYNWEQKNFKKGFKEALESFDSSSDSLFAAIFGQYTIRRALKDDEPYNKSFNEFISKTIIYNDKEGKVDRLSRDSDLLLFSNIVDAMIQNNKIGIRVSVSVPFFQMQPGEVVSVSSQDWRCYAHPFKPKAILEPTAIKIASLEDVPVELTSGHYKGLFLRSDIPGNLPSSIDINNTSYSNYISKINTLKGGLNTGDIGGRNWNEFIEDRIILDVDVTNDKSRGILEDKYVVLVDGTDDAHTYLVKLDEYEKWSLFKSNIRTVYAHWYSSGFLDENYRENSVIKDIISQRYHNKKSLKIDDDDSIYFHQKLDGDNNIYFHQPYAYESPSKTHTKGRKINTINSSQFKPPKVSIPSSISLPEPVNYNYIEHAGIDYKEKGEEIGRRLKNLDYDITQHKINIKERNGDDYMTSSLLRKYKTDSDDKPGEFYTGNLGAYGIEEYVVRIPFTELPNILVNGTASVSNSDLARNVIKNIELIKAMMIIARTYHMSRSISLGLDSTKTSGFSYDYKREVKIPATDDWQVMSLGNHNIMVKGFKSLLGNYKYSEIVRLVLEETMYETWGEIFLHKGVIVEAIFKGATGDPSNDNEGGVRGDRSGETKYEKRYYNALRRVYTPANHVDSAAGAGFGQHGGEILARDVGASAHQIIHWYYYGCHIINAWGLGDCVSRFPNATGQVDSSNAYPWLAYKTGLPAVALPSSNIYKDIEDNVWKNYDSDVSDNTHTVVHKNIVGNSFRFNSEVWGLGRRGNTLNSDKFNDTSYKDSTGNDVIGFNVSQKLISKLNRIVMNHEIQVLSNNDYFMRIKDPTYAHALVINFNGSFVTPTEAILSTLKLNNVKIVSDNLVILGANTRMIRRTDGERIDESILNKIGKNSKEFTFWAEFNNVHLPKMTISMFYLINVQ